MDNEEFVEFNKSDGNETLKIDLFISLAFVFLILLVAFYEP